ncbi:phytoene/squalene synthase family protein [Rothia terrae]|uniref:phytoene/squalene synthase family protein n=1 Tax=Rothia terrae TaxID=396015 RepID=UPI002881102A|nr:squalene/phytoene synthase family protein [Rothia terrae]MDT0189326.1 squalene/phytoene synthase family protein [Rothia terrae]
MNHRNRLDLYTRTARDSSSPVLKHYSKSFGLASRLYPRELRTSIACIYALVRVADEIVDGTAHQAGLSLEQQTQVLNDLEKEVENALVTGFSANLIVHAFAYEARNAGITVELTRAFFNSMRTDLQPVNFHSDQEYRTYIYGSAEVIGLMCLKLFLKGKKVQEGEEKKMKESAQSLGAAFQKINFLRDYSYDSQNLKRQYFPQVQGHMTERQRDEIITDIRDDLQRARIGIVLLPLQARVAVRAATAIFEHLLDELAHQPLQELLTGRLSVKKSDKARIIAQELLRR